jgi:hypothetical protein
MVSTTIRRNSYFRTTFCASPISPGIAPQDLVADISDMLGLGQVIAQATAPPPKQG